MKINELAGGGPPQITDNGMAERINKMTESVDRITENQTVPSVELELEGDCGPGEDVTSVVHLSDFNFNSPEMWATISFPFNPKSTIGTRMKWHEIFKFVRVVPGIWMRIGARNRKAFAAGIMLEMDIITNYRPIERPECHLAFRHRLRCEDGYTTGAPTPPSA